MARKAWGAAVQNREELFELKRQAVLRTAAVMIRRRGYETLSLGGIADELQISKPTVYYYFRNKSEIVLEILRLAVDEMLDGENYPEDDPNAPGLNGAQRLERFLRRCVRILGEDAGSCLLSMPREMLEPEIQAQFLAKGRPVDTMAEGILRSGIEDGSLTSCDTSATYLMIAGALRYIPTLHFDQKIPIASLANSLVHLLMGGLRAAPDQKSQSVGD